MIPDWITALAAFAALLLSGYNAYAQWRDKRPRLKVSTDERLPEDVGFIYSVRVVNEGSVPAQVRLVRLFLERRRRRFRLGFPPWRIEEGRSLPFPSVGEGRDDISPNLWANEKDTSKDLPYMLQQGESVRFSTLRWNISTALGTAGLHGEGGSEDAKLRVGVVDALDRVHAVEDAVYVDPPDPEP